MRGARWLSAAAWGVALVAGALYLKLARPESHHPWLAVLMASEPFHVLAHLVLYGALALLFRLAVGRRPAIVLACVVCVGVAQEAAQIFHVRRPGGPEAFDLCVDAIAATLVLVALHVRDRRRQSE